MRRALMIAYHFPPTQGSSGVLRTLSFARHLPEFGWEPLVLTVHPRAYPQTSDHQMSDIPEGLVVKRAFALDTARHLAIRGAYLGPLAAPDRWWTWWLGAVPAGLRMIRRYRPEVIWSTAPIATAHMIGLTLHRLTGLPWVADIRDLLTEPDEPEDPTAWRATRWIERRTLRRSTRTVVVSPGQRDEYARQFPDLPEGKTQVIPNGFEEAPFRDAEALRPATTGGNRMVLVHSGVLYPDSRNPETFLEALKELIEAGRIHRDELEVRLRASGSEDLYHGMLARLGLEDVVTLLPALPYREGLAEMLAADGLLLFQGSGSNSAIPAKLYEYFRAGRPILALTDPRGATAQALERAGYDRIAALDSKAAILPVLGQFLDETRAKEGFALEEAAAQRYSRASNCQELARLFETVCPGRQG
jgi:glycosyltransferase involved in cell wall biosynthesis